MQLSQKQKTFSQIFVAFLNFRLNFKHFEKKKMSITAFVFPKLGTLKTFLDKCLKSPVSEDPSTSNMVNVPKHLPNLDYITCIILMRHYKVN